MSGDPGRATRVIVIGNCTVDLSFSVPTLPRPGETILASERRVDLGGKGANQAVVASRFGIDTVLAAPIGSDREGEWACERLAQEGLSLAAVSRTSLPTDQSVIWVASDGANSIVSTCEAALSVSPEWASAIVRQHGRAGDILLLQGNLSLDTTHAALSAARQAGLVTVLNPAPVQYSCEALFPLVDVAVLNEIEAVALGGLADPLDAGASIHAGGVPSVIVTLGDQGAVLITPEGTRHIPAPAVAAIDTVGAGDTLCGALVAGLARGASLAEALRIGVAAASLTVTRQGTQRSFPTRAEATSLVERSAW